MRDSDITVVHADDDWEFTERVHEYVEQQHDDVSVRTVRNADAVFAHLEASDDVDCVVSDYEVPGIDGLELLETVHERWPDLPTILVTDRGDEEVATEAIDAGVTDYLRKESSTAGCVTLVNRVRNAVARHRAEVELELASRRTEAEFGSLVEPIEDHAIFFLDENGYVRTWNRGAEAIKGYAREEIVGRHVSVLYRDEEVATGAPERDLRKAATEGHTETGGWLVREDGSEFWADVTITAVYRSDELVGYTMVTRDSIQRHQEQELLAQKERLEDLIAAISHDLRNPLAVAEGNVQLSAETGDLSHLDGATQALGRANDLLDYLARLAEEGNRRGELERVDLREVAEAAWSVVETDGARLDVEESTVIVGDRQRFQQLLENLFGNAVKHGSTSPHSQARGDAVKHGSTNPRSQAREDSAERSSASSRTQSGDAVKHWSTDGRPPTATVGPEARTASGSVVSGVAVEQSSTSPPSLAREDAVEPSGPQVTVRVGLLDRGGFYVEDDGPGISEDERSEIFEMGYSGNGEGTGFGLAICQQIVDVHGWSIAVTDGSDGGARFEVSGVGPA